MPVRLSPRAVAFLRESVRSTHELDTVLLLYRDPSRWWSAEQIAETLGLNTELTARTLEALAGRNLLDVRVGGTLAYCFSPIHGHLFETLGEIAFDPAAARDMVSSPKVSRTDSP